MQVAAQPPPLLLAREDEPLPGALQVLAQAGRLHGRRERPGQFGEHLVVPPAPASAADGQLADRRPGVHERQPADASRGHGSHGRQHVALGRGHGQGVQPQGVGDGGQDVGERPVRRDRLLQPRVQGAEHRLRVVPRAVGEPVDRALDRLAQRLERDGHDRGGQPGQPAGAARVHHRARAGDDEHVQRGDRGREQGVEQRAVDQHVDLVEPVLEHGDPDRGRERGDGEGEDRRGEHPRRQERHPDEGDEQPEGEPADLLADQRRAVPPPGGDRHEARHQARDAEAEDHQRGGLGDRSQGGRETERVVDPGHAGRRRGSASRASSPRRGRGRGRPVAATTARHPAPGRRRGTPAAGRRPAPSSPARGR